MRELLKCTPEHFSRCCVRASLVVLLLTMGARSVRAQGWSGSFEKVDSGAKFTSLAVDSGGSVHVGYVDNSRHVVKFAFRSAESSRWYTLVIEKDLQNAATFLTLDSQGNPHMCYPDWGSLKHAYWSGKLWIIHEISPGGAKDYTCSLAISSDGTPYVSWNQARAPNGTSYYHIRTAVLQDGAWLARTLDFDGEAGKWNSTVLHNRGKPIVSYSIFPTGELKIAQFNAKKWQVSFIDSTERDSSIGIRGMGNWLRVDAQTKLPVL